MMWSDGLLEEDEVIRRLRLQKRPSRYAQRKARQYHEPHWYRDQDQCESAEDPRFRKNPLNRLDKLTSREGKTPNTIHALLDHGLGYGVQHYNGHGQS